MKRELGKLAKCTWWVSPQSPSPAFSYIIKTNRLSSLAKGSFPPLIPLHQHLRWLSFVACSPKWACHSETLRWSFLGQTAPLQPRLDCPSTASFPHPWKLSLIGLFGLTQCDIFNSPFLWGEKTVKEMRQGGRECYSTLSTVCVCVCMCFNCKFENHSSGCLFVMEQTVIAKGPAVPPSACPTL